MQDNRWSMKLYQWKQLEEERKTAKIMVKPSDGFVKSRNMEEDMAEYRHL
jgi:hypothetical protein